MNAYHYIIFNLTNKCNTYCRYCFQDSLARNSTFLPLATVKACLDRCAERTDSKLFVQFTGGEPSIHPDFWEIWNYSRAKGFNIKFQTNGLTLAEMSKERLAQMAEKGVVVKASLDGFDEATHEFMRARGSFKKIMAGVEALMAFKPRFAFKAVLSKPVADDFQKMLDLSLSIGAIGISYNFLRTEGRASDLQNEVNEYNFTERWIDVFNQPKYKHLLNGTNMLRIWAMPQKGFEGQFFYVNCDGNVYPSQKMNPLERIGNANESVECLDDTKLIPQVWEVPLKLFQLVKNRLKIRAVNPP